MQRGRDSASTVLEAPQDPGWDSGVGAKAAVRLGEEGGWDTEFTDQPASTPVPGKIITEAPCPSSATVAKTVRFRLWAAAAAAAHVLYAKPLHERQHVPWLNLTEVRNLRT